MADVKSGIGGWLLVLCGVLLVWQPVSFALVAAAALAALPVRGAPLALVLAARLVVTALGIAAGLTLAARRPAAVTLANVSLVTSAAMDLFVYATPYSPNDRSPGTTPIYVSITLVWYAAWIVYLLRSRRVRATF